MTKLCWICSGPAETREHKFKKTDVDRAGGGWTLGERPHFFGANGLSVIRGPDSKLVKFVKVLCQNCNSARTQPYDNAALAPAELGNAVFATKTLQHDADLFFRRELATGRAPDILYDFFCRRFLRPGFLSHLRS